ncbi:hypothetical protein E2C01_017758 [Portunus trituberculatus]|uniref:Reverse transcriptase domain-containing protein n=1 Tax=Portunus trituberculatus TaxID=210409 RepID=A0A5B7DTB4_PORTR|nr:hypothetical protein [Portunus trituberculatus]
MGKSNRKPMWEYKMREEVIMKRSEEKDLGVIIQDTLIPERHINMLFASTYKTLTNIKYMEKSMMKMIITMMIRPRFEYALVVWSPHMQKDIRKLERIQRIATKMVSEVKDLPYEDRLVEIEG